MLQPFWLGRLWELSSFKIVDFEELEEIWSPTKHGWDRSKRSL